MVVKEKTIDIMTSPDKIWEMLAADMIPVWQPYMAKNKRREYITSISSQEDKYKIGTIMHFDGSCHFEVIGGNVDERLVYHIYENSILGKLGGRIIFTIEPIESGCHFVYRTEMEFPNRFIQMLVTNYFTMRWFDKQVQTNLGNLKSILENREQQ